LLPIYVFSRAYSLYFLRQFGNEYNLLVELPSFPVSGFPVVMLPPAPGAPPTDGGGQRPDFGP
jgi:hypothetical protein